MKALLEGSLSSALQEAAANANAVDADSRFPIEAVRELKKARLLGALVPRECGGLGLSLSETAAVCHALGTACASTAMIFAMHHSQIACLVTHARTQPWFSDLLQRVADEQLLLASVTSEVGTGGSIRTSRCAIEGDGPTFRLEKHATAISYGAHADVLTVTARRDAAAAASDQVLVAACSGDYTLDRTTIWDALGMRGTCTDGFVVRIAAERCQVVDVPYAEVAETMLAASHTLWSAVWLGVATDAVQRARMSLRDDMRRKRGEGSASASRLATACGKLLTVQQGLASVLHALERQMQAGGPLSTSSLATLNMLKMSVSEATLQAAMEALAIVGISGYRNGGEYSMGRHLRDLMSAPLMIGNDRIRDNTANLLLMQMPQLGRFEF